LPNKTLFVILVLTGNQKVRKRMRWHTLADVYELSEAREEKENNLKSRRKRVAWA